MTPNIKFLTTTSDISKCYQLKRSLMHFGWDFHIIEHEWKGFGGKIIETYNYLKANPDITHFFYSDAWDTFVLGTMEEAIGKLASLEVIFFGTEKACYPHPEKADKYPERNSPWKYLNGGVWFAPADLFCKMVESAFPANDVNDQAWFTDRFLEGYINLNYSCDIFQTIAFTATEEVVADGERLLNTILGTKPIFIHGNGHTPMDQVYDLLPVSFDRLKDVRSMWTDQQEIHRLINDRFTDLVNADPKLKAYRDWIEGKIFGFGERSFLWMWKLLVDEIPEPNFLEIGVFRGQIIGLIRMLSPGARVTGITPLTSAGGHWESDYAADIKLLHDTFSLEHPAIIKGMSTDDDAYSQAEAGGPYDILYIDGGHDYHTARHDVYKYSSLVKVGGYLVVDDCAHRYKLPDGYFRGIESVSRAVDELLPNDYYTELFNVVHNRIFKRIK